jgi:hypothetical protein
LRLILARREYFSEELDWERKNLEKRHNIVMHKIYNMIIFLLERLRFVVAIYRRLGRAETLTTKKMDN